MKLSTAFAAVGIQVCVAMAIAPVASAQAADTFPERPVRVVVPYPPGGTTDVLVRMLQKPVGDAAGQQVIIDNRPGGASVIGTSNVANSPPDGYTVLGGDLSLLVNPSLIKTLPYDTLRDFQGVTMLARAPLVLLVHPSVPANTLEELLELAKSKPGALNYASGGYGTSTHIAGAMFTRATDADIAHIPFQGVAPAMNALLGGQVQMYFGGTTTGLPHIQAGTLRALAVTGDEPSPLLPDVPTFKSRGIEGVNADTYWGIYAPAKTPKAQIEVLNKHFVSALESPDIVKRTQDLGLTLIGNTATEHDAQMRTMIQEWQEVIESNGIEMN